MPLPFTHLVALLDPLSALYTKSPPLKRTVLGAQSSSIITQWFDHHRPLFTSTRLEPVALFSLLFPELRCDRVYALREEGLVKVIARCLGLGVTRQRQLGEWRKDADGDLGKMVGRVMRAAENPSPPVGEEVTVEEIDEALEELARRSVFSSPGKRRGGGEGRPAHEILTPLFRRMSSAEGMWLTRAILKCYLPLVIPERVTMYNYHFLLPHLWAFQNDLRKAVGMLDTPVFRIFPPKPEKRDVRELMDGAVKLVKPEVGVRIKRVGYAKARSCKHAATLAGGARMSMERKYDGEYCQIHIDLSKPGKDWITIFSKSGRDSTQDRIGAHGVIREALRIHKPQERGFRSKCILEGELVVFCETEKRILEFYHLRSHVSRSGVFIGTSADERPDFRTQHLMLIFYDVLLIDYQPYLTLPYDRRISALTSLIHPRPGHAELASRFEIDFSTGPVALENLREKFAQGIAQRWEGFVLKPCEEPYLGFGARNVEWIKLKKDYIRGMGDTADFCVVGGGYEPKRGRARGVAGEGLTTFFVGALENKDAVVRFGARPMFKVVFHVSYSISRPDLEHLNRVAYFRASEYQNTHPEEFDLDIAPNLPKMDVYFTTPMVFEVTGGGFDKASDTDYYILRWPRVVKIHWDRDWKDAVGFEELQEMAEEAVSALAGVGQEQEEERKWVQRLEEGDLGSRGKRKAATLDQGEKEDMERENMQGKATKRRGTEAQVHGPWGGPWGLGSIGEEDMEVESTPCRSQMESQLPSLPSSAPGLSEAPPIPPPQQKREVMILSAPEHAMLDPGTTKAPLLTLPSPQDLIPSTPPSLSSTTNPRPPLHTLSPDSVSNPQPNPQPQPQPTTTMAATSAPNEKPPPQRAPSPSPLLNATLFLIPSVLSQPELGIYLPLHRPKAVYSWEYLPAFFGDGSFPDSPSADAELEDDPPSSPLPPPSSPLLPTITLDTLDRTLERGNDNDNEPQAERTLILLIDTCTPRTSKRFMARILKRIPDSLKVRNGVFGIQIYDWRAIKHSDWKGEKRLVDQVPPASFQVGNENRGGVKRITSWGVNGGGDGGKGRRVDWDLFFMVEV